jgi:hypothetical protein
MVTYFRISVRKKRKKCTIVHQQPITAKGTPQSINPRCLSQLCWSEVCENAKENFLGETIDEWIVGLYKKALSTYYN